jgi:phytoene dehydrogenase-like protein
MSFLRGLFDRLLLVGAALGGGLLPGFISQYRQRLGGRLDQARLDLDAWQKIADRFFQGDINQLIRNHLGSADPAIHAEGGLVQSLLDTVRDLQSAAAALNGSLWHQLAYLALHTDPQLARATFRDWIPTFSLAPDGLLFAALFALAVWVVFQLLWWLIATAIAALAGALRAPARRAGGG